MIQHHSAGIIVYCCSKKYPLYLLLKYAAGHWDFPKGHIEKGESKQEAALRELKEETALTVDIDKGFEAPIEYYFKDKNKQLVHKVVYFFAGETDRQDVQLSDEHLDYTWLPFKEASEQLTFQSAQEVLEKVQRFLTMSQS